MKDWPDADMPCRRNCTDRTVGCHANCERYAEWKAAHLQKKDTIYQNKRKVTIVDGHQISTSRKLKKRMGGNK